MTDDDLPQTKKRLPTKTSFRPGECGNRKGRPPGSIGLGARMKKAAARKIEVTVRGRRKLVSLEDVAAERIVANMAKGDLKALEFYLRETGKLAAAKGDQPQNIFPDLDRETKRLIGERLLQEVAEEEAEERAKNEASGGTADEAPAEEGADDRI